MNWIKSNLAKVYFAVLCLLIAINVAASLTGNVMVLQVVKPLYVPVFALFYFSECKFINVYLVCFLMFTFLGDLTSEFYGNMKLSHWCNFFYLVSHISLLGYAISKFKGIRFNTMLEMYLILVFLINTYLLYQLYVVLDTLMTDSVEVMFFGLRSVTLLLLAFISFAIYLNTENKSSILYLIMAICFVFSEVLFYIRNYYIHHWGFLLFERALYGLALFNLYIFMVNKNTVRERAEKIRGFNFVFQKKSTKQ